MIRLFYDISMTLEALSDRLGGAPGVTHERSFVESEKARVGKVLEETFVKTLVGAKLKSDVLIAGVGLKAVDCREEGGPPDGGGLGRLTEETHEGQKRVRARNELEALCILADEKLGLYPNVSVVREYDSDEVWCWTVKIKGGAPVDVEVRHPDLLVALGMAASALDTEGV